MASEVAPESIKGPAGPSSTTDQGDQGTSTTINETTSSSQTSTPVPATPARRENVRPKSIGRQNSGTIIIPRDANPMPTPQGEYPPDDARAMSPRRTSEETDKLGEETRLAVQK